MRLENEVALVTGAGRGIGAAVARRLAADGARVAVSDLDAAACERIAEEIGPAATAVPIDVADEASVIVGVATARERLGELTVLVNNAGVNRIGPSERLSATDWEAVVDVNLTGVFRCSQVVGARMLAAGHGSIVNMASAASQVAWPGRAAYGATKTAVVGLTRALGVEWAGRGVRVNAVAPGYVRTPLIANAIERGLYDEEQLLARIPAGRLCEPEDVAAAVAFLASSDARYITATTLAVDGGFLAYGDPTPAWERPATDIAV